jgi:hypothetical protein
MHLVGPTILIRYIVQIYAPREPILAYFTFISIGKLILNYARSSGEQSSHKIRLPCVIISNFLIKSIWF